MATGENTVDKLQASSHKHVKGKKNYFKIYENDIKAIYLSPRKKEMYLLQKSVQGTATRQVELRGVCSFLSNC